MPSLCLLRAVFALSVFHFFKVQPSLAYLLFAHFAPSLRGDAKSFLRFTLYPTLGIVKRVGSLLAERFG